MKPYSDGMMELNLCGRSSDRKPLALSSSNFTVSWSSRESVSAGEGGRGCRWWGGEGVDLGHNLDIRCVKSVVQAGVDAVPRVSFVSASRREVGAAQ